jgi:hypothetical protein
LAFLRGFYALLVDARRVGVGTDFGDAAEVLNESRTQMKKI